VFPKTGEEESAAPGMSRHTSLRNLLRFRAFPPRESMDAVMALLTAAGSAGTAPGHASLDADMTDRLTHGSLELWCDGDGRWTMGRFLSARLDPADLN